MGRTSRSARRRSSRVRSRRSRRRPRPRALNLEILDPWTRPFENVRVAAHSTTSKLKQILGKNSLNLVTVESLTAGMIAKTIVDTPQPTNSVLYGGFVVYDTDAKRQWCGVKTTGVYSEKTAHEMAEGALRNSRAMVALSVTGNAMPLPHHKDMLGVVDIGVSFRTDPEFLTYTKHFDVSQEDEIFKVWKDLNSTNPKKKFAPLSLTSMVADVIRMRTVVEACRFATDQLNKVLEIVKETDKLPDKEKIEWATLPEKQWDECSEPSWVIKARDGETDTPRSQSDSRDEEELSCMSSLDAAGTSLAGDVLCPASKKKEDVQ